MGPSRQIKPGRTHIASFSCWKDHNKKAFFSSKSFLLLKCLFSFALRSFSFYLFFYRSLSRFISEGLHFDMTDNSAAIFWKTVHLFGGLTMCTNQRRLLQLHKASVLINCTSFHSNCYAILWNALHSSHCFLFYAFPQAFPQGTSAESTHSHCFSALIPSPQIYSRSRPLQTHRTTIHPH